MFLHDIQNLFLHSYQIVKIHPFLHYTQRKSTGFYTIARLIFLKSYSIIHGGFFGVSGLGEECQGLGLWYLLTNHDICRLKDKMIGKKSVRSSLGFPLSASLSNFCSNDQTAQRQ